jgi:hypothetical protein
MARGVKGTGPYGQKAAKAVVKEAAPVKPPKPKEFVVTINEYGKDPEFFVTALSKAEALTKAIGAFKANFPKDDVEDISVEEADGVKRFLVP